MRELFAAHGLDLAQEPMTLEGALRRARETTAQVVYIPSHGWLDHDDAGLFTGRQWFSARRLELSASVKGVVLDSCFTRSRKWLEHAPGLKGLAVLGGSGPDTGEPRPQVTHGRYLLTALVSALACAADTTGTDQQSLGVEQLTQLLKEVHLAAARSAEEQSRRSTLARAYGLAVHPTQGA